MQLCNKKHVIINKTIPLSYIEAILADISKCAFYLWTVQALRGTPGLLLPEKRPFDFIKAPLSEQFGRMCLATKTLLKETYPLG